MSSQRAALCLCWLEKAAASLCELGGMPFQHINLPFKFPLKVARAELPAQRVLLVSFRLPEFLTFQLQTREPAEPRHAGRQPEVPAGLRPEVG